MPIPPPAWRLSDVFTSPEFAGLHWSIPVDTPDDDRARAHYIAAHAAKAARDREQDRPRTMAYNPQADTYLLAWPNGSLVWSPAIEIAANGWRVQ